MILLPAIDLKGGECVRLLRGDYGTAQKVADSAVDTALAFRASGAKWLHMVDLDGAKAGEPENADLIFRVLAACGLSIEVGGGIRSMETVSFYLGRGISRVILGSAALSRPGLVREAARKYGEKIAVGIDARDGKVSVEGWTETSDVDYLSFAEQMERIGVKYIIFTDISRDGTLSGPNLEMLDRLNQAVSCHVTASGGVSNLKDIANLLDLNLYGAICGKALYSGDLSLKAALSLCGGNAG